MASELFGQRFRRAFNDPGPPNAIFDDPEVDDYGLQAEEAYPGGTMRVHVAFAVQVGIRDIMGSKAKLVSYSQNSASVSLSDAVRNLKILYDTWKDELDAALSESSGGGVRFGSLSKFPTRRKELPDA